MAAHRWRAVGASARLALIEEHLSNKQNSLAAPANRPVQRLVLISSCRGVFPSSIVLHSFYANSTRKSTASVLVGYCCMKTLTEHRRKCTPLTYHSAMVCRNLASRKMSWKSRSKMNRGVFVRILSCAEMGGHGQTHAIMRFLLRSLRGPREFRSDDELGPRIVWANVNVDGTTGDFTRIP